MHYDNYNLHCVISIHALLAESDSGHPDTRRPCAISIHALLAESDACTMTTTICTASFLSTLSLRRATGCEQYYIHAPGISIHALLAESDTNRRPIFFEQAISIHALLAESDKTRSKRINRNVAFLSTLSLRRATKPMPLTRFSRGIFLSTLSLRRATAADISERREARISIHALLAESDLFYR